MNDINYLPYTEETAMKELIYYPLRTGLSPNPKPKKQNVRHQGEKERARRQRQKEKATLMAERGNMNKSPGFLQGSHVKS